MIEDGQYGWSTRFDQIGVQAVLPGDLELIAQWMSGTSQMGSWRGDWHPVDVSFAANFVLLAKAFGPDLQQNIALRYDDFDVTDLDELFEDTNTDFGHAWTVTYQYALSEHVTLAAEWLRIRTHHCGWAYYGLDPVATETQSQLLLRLRF